MAYRNICGWETGDSSEARATSGTFSIQSATKRTGTYALRLNPTAAKSYWTLGGLAATGVPTSMGLTTGYVTAYLRFATLPSANTTIMRCGVQDDATAGAEVVWVRVDSSGNLTIAATTAGASSTVATLVTNTWYRLDLKVVQNGTCEAKIDGGTAQTITGENNAFHFCQLGNAETNGTYDVYYDDIAISDSAYPGAGEVRILKPNGAGTTTQWTTGTGNTYAEVDEVPHDGDTTYIASNTAGQQSDFTMEDSATVGIVGTIGVTKSIAIARDEGTGSFFQLRTNSRGNTTDADLTTSYQCIAKMLTGTETAALVDSLELRPYNGDNDNLRVTALYAMVWCTGQINTTVTPGAASLTTTRYSPSAKVNNIATPGALSLTTTRYAPTALLNSIATPGALSAALTAYTPTVTVGLAVAPGALAAALTAYAPTVVNPQSATPGAASLTLTPYAPGAVVNNIVTPGAGALALTAYGLLAAFATIVTPGAGAMGLTAYAPGALLNNIATPGALSAALTGYAPSVLTPVVVTPATLSAVLTAHAPGAPIGTKVTPGALSAALTAYGLAVNIGWQLTPGPASLAVMTYGLSWTLSGFPNPDRRLYGAGRFAAGGYGSGRFGSINRGTGRSDQPGRGAGR